MLTSKSRSVGSLRNSSRAHAQLLIRDICDGVNRATSESGSGGRPARFSGATRFGRAFGAFTGATHVALCVRQHAIQQYAARHFGQLYFAAGVAQTAQGRSGRGIDAARQAALLLLWRRHWGLSRDCAGEALAQACLWQCYGHGELVLTRRARISTSNSR